jgi:flavin reductase (DIM6/NTAB) family NADH-FMN oxidoreductase RutF
MEDPMNKVPIDQKSIHLAAPAMPVLLVGADVDGKANFLTIAWSGVACAEPLMFSIPIRHQRYTMKGVNAGKVFSINVPNVDLVRETDYCGIYSGAKVDKAEACRFSIFYGKIPGAPFIRECPVNISCSVHQLLDLGSHILVIGKAEETLVSDDCMVDGKPDIEKIRPIVYVTTPERRYVGLGKPLGAAFSIGKELA